MFVGFCQSVVYNTLFVKLIEYVCTSTYNCAWCIALPQLAPLMLIRGSQMYNVLTTAKYISLNYTVDGNSDEWTSVYLTVESYYSVCMNLIAILYCRIQSLLTVDSARGTEDQPAAPTVRTRRWGKHKQNWQASLYNLLKSEDVSCYITLPT